MVIVLMCIGVTVGFLGCILNISRIIDVVFHYCSRMNTDRTYRERERVGNRGMVNSAYGNYTGNPLRSEGGGEMGGSLV